MVDVFLYFVSTFFLRQRFSAVFLFGLTNRSFSAGEDLLWVWTLDVLSVLHFLPFGSHGIYIQATDGAWAFPGN